MGGLAFRGDARHTELTLREPQASLFRGPLLLRPSFLLRGGNLGARFGAQSFVLSFRFTAAVAGAGQYCTDLFQGVDFGVN